MDTVCLLALDEDNIYKNTVCCEENFNYVTLISSNKAEVEENEIDHSHANTPIPLDGLFKTEKVSEDNDFWQVLFVGIVLGAVGTLVIIKLKKNNI